MPGQSRRQPRLLDSSQLRDYAMKALGRRARSIAELRRLLERRAAAPADIDGVIAFLKEYGLLDDDRFAQIYASHRLENNRIGQRRVERDLRAHLVNPKLAKKAVAAVYEEVDETALLREHLARHLRRRGAPKDRRATASLYRHLVGAGFSPGVIFPELRRIARGDPELLEQLPTDE